MTIVRWLICGGRLLTRINLCKWGMGNGEWGMGNGEHKSYFPLPTPHSPFPTPYPLGLVATIRICFCASASRASSILPAGKPLSLSI